MRAVFEQIAIGQQHWKFGFVGTQGHAVTGHHIGAVQKIGDAPETLRFTLREEGVVAHIQTHQLGVFGGVAGGENFQRERRIALGQIFQHQFVAFDLERGALSIDQYARQIKVFAIEPQGLRGHIGVAAQRHLVEHARFGGVEVEAQVHGIDPESRGGVVPPVNHRGRLALTH